MPSSNPDLLILTDAEGLANFTESALLVLQLSRCEVEAGNVASALERLHVVAETRESALRYRESLVFNVSGYEADRRELAEIPEVRRFFAKLTQEWPHWLWFLHRQVGAIPLLFALLCQVKIHRTPGAFGTEFLDREELGAKMADLFNRGNAMFTAYGMSSGEISASAQSAVAELTGGMPYGN